MSNFFQNKKIFITGVDGFVGSNLAKHLIGLGSKIFGLAKNNKKESLLYYENLDSKIKIYYGNVTNRLLLKKILTRNKIEIVFHLAAQVEVGIANKNPLNTWETNIRGTYVLLESIRKYSKFIKSIIVASSDKAYGSYPKKMLPYKESYDLRPIFPYDTSKACADMICRSYSGEIFNLPIVVTRFANIYGPGQLNFSALIPDLLKSIIKNKVFKLRGDGTDLRDFVYIKDIIKAYLVLSKSLYRNKLLSGEIFNAGTNKPIKIIDVIKLFYEYFQKYEDFEKIKNLIKNKKKSTGEIPFQSMDYKKLYKFFKWKPKYNLSNTIEETYKWYYNFFKKKI